MGPLSVDKEAAAGKKLTRPRPGHADLAGGMKYGARDLRDVLERASARESAARVAAGAVCKLLLSACGIELASGVLSVGAAADSESARTFASAATARDDTPLRAMNAEAERRMVEAVDAAKREGETLGGSILLAARGVPPGLGSYASWDRKLDGRIAQALLSVPAVKAVEFGAAIEASRGPGSQAHDEIEPGPDGRLRRRSNRAGGLEAGVTNGEDLVAVLFMKPISTLARGLDSVDLETGEPARSAYERSDVTAVPACGVIAEAMLAFVLADAVSRIDGRGPDGRRPGEAGAAPRAVRPTEAANGRPSPPPERTRTGSTRLRPRTAHRFRFRSFRVFGGPREPAASSAPTLIPGRGSKGPGAQVASICASEEGWRESAWSRTAKSGSVGRRPVPSGRQYS